MNLENYLNQQSKIIDTALDKCLPEANVYPQKIHQAIRYSVFSGGKRIRPILAIEACKVCGGRLKDVLIYAAAVELVHNFSLVHDDLPALDNDDFRRGRPTVHKKFDEAVAILCGDALLNLSFNLITRGHNFKAQSLIVQELSGAIGTFGMVGGQVADISPDKNNTRRIHYINYHKTAKFIASCLKIGAIAAGAPRQWVNRLYVYGENIGLLFQITDDILDNDGLVKLIGIDLTKQKAQALSCQAKKRLEIFGPRAKRLREITEYILNRKR